MTIEYRSFHFTPYGENWTLRHYAPDPFGDVRERVPAEVLVGDKLIGHAVVYNSDSHDLGGFIERVDPGALTRSLKAAAAGTLNIHGLWSHDSSQPLGSTRGGKLKLASDSEGLAFELDTTRFTPAQLDAARDGDLQMSFGFRVVKDSWTYRDDGVAERTLLDVDLFEVSPVISPAYPDTTAAMRSLEAFKAVQQVEDKYGGNIAAFEDTVAEMKTRSDAASARVKELHERAAEAARSVADAAHVTDHPEYQIAPKGEQLQENPALKIKRALLKRALEQHISRLPQVE